VAHRGNAAEFPENTLAAVDSALRLGLRFVEIDVHLARDLEPMVIHDHNLLRTAGRDASVFDLDSTTLTQIEACERTRFADRHAGTRIPRLRDFAALIANHPQARAFVEIKCASIERFGHQEIVSHVLAAIAACSARCIVISFDLEVLRVARQAGAAAIGWVLPQWSAEVQADWRMLSPEFVFVDQAKLPANESVWPGTGQWCSYEVTSAAMAQSLAARGVTLMETMRVREALGWKLAPLVKP
jgi:glycerophosphoryl diester phosphodiesterase